MLRAYFGNKVDLDNNGIHPYFWNNFTKTYEKNFWADKFIDFYDHLEMEPKMAFDVVRFSPTRVGVVDKASNLIMFFWSSEPCTDLPIGKQIYIHYYVCRNFPIFVPIIDRSRYVLDEQIHTSEEETNLRFNWFFKNGQEVLEQQFYLAFESNLATTYDIHYDEGNKEIVINPDNLVIKGR